MAMRGSPPGSSAQERNDDAGSPLLRSLTNMFTGNPIGAPSNPWKRDQAIRQQGKYMH
jgi:hypothetical protein